MTGAPLPSVKQAAATLRSGGLVAFPTETVYGLGADASNPAAVARIYAVKGRPSSHPVIVHIGGAVELGRWAREVPAHAVTLAARFWPGPLTLVLRRASSVGDELTGGQDTIGLRVPGHPVALELLREFGGGIAAPSANRFGRISPTTADHVRNDLGTDVDLILDGGACEIGIESTIVDVSRGMPVLLRPGRIGASEIADAIGVAPRPPDSHTLRGGRCASFRRATGACKTLRAAASCLSGSGQRGTLPRPGSEFRRTRSTTDTISTPTCARWTPLNAMRSWSRSRLPRPNGPRYATA